MRRLASLCLSVPLLAHAQKPDTMLRVQPGVRIGPVTRQATAMSLGRLLGPAAVAAARVDDLGGEGGTTPATILWPGDSTRRAVVYWADTLGASHPVLVTLAATATRWELPHGLRLGMSLADVARANGATFRFAGFGWDLGGRTRDWQGGAMAAVARSGITVTLELTPGCLERLSAEERNTLTGDVLISSSAAAARKACIAVSGAMIGFTSPP
jgi:hypothetical protein